MNPKNNKNAIVQAVEEARRRQAAIQALLKMNQSTQAAANATPSQSKDLLSVYGDILKPVADLGKSAGQFTLDTFGKAVKPVADLGASAWESVSDALKINAGQDSWVRDFIDPKLFDDGYDFGDVSRSILGTAADAGADFIAGIGEGVEGIIDGGSFFGAYLMDKTMAPLIWPAIDAFTSFVLGRENDHLMENQWNSAYSDTIDIVKSDLIKTDEFEKHLREVTGYDWEQESILGEHSDNLVQSVPPLIANAYASAHGFPSWIIPFFNAFGGKADQVLNEGATDNEAFFNALITAMAEVATEKISSGILPGGGSSLDDVLMKSLSKIPSKTLRNGIKFLVSVGGEGIEEMLAEDASTIADWLTHKSDQDLIEMLTSDEAWKNRLYAGLGGMILGGGSEAINIKQTGKSGRDAVTGLTANEETVVQAETERRAAEYKADGKKANIGKIRDEVIESMKRGDISLEAIESSLGGEVYRRYTEAKTKQKGIQEELKRAAATIDALYGKGDLTEQEQAELDKAVQSIGNLSAQEKALKVDDARQNLHEYVNNLTKTQGDAYLRGRYEGFNTDKVYRAKNKKNQAAVDATIESAKKAGLNNTRRVHDLVDFAAKISADTGLVFNLSNSKRIKDAFVQRQTADIQKLEAIPEAERTAAQKKTLEEMRELLAKVKSGDITINGTNSGNMITLNLGSPDPLNRIAGHEISHSLENAKAYDALRDSLLAYAKSKGVDTDKLLGEYRKRYQGANNADAEREMIADMVGDYLFSDENFVKHLTKNRNLFQRVYDEIKYLLKLATTGSQEARELERVKHLFDKAYKQMGNANADTGTQYSFSSMSHTFFGNEDMSTLDWKKADYKSTEGYQAYVDKCVNNIRQSRPDFDEQAARQEVERSIDGIVRVAIAAKEAGYDIYDDAKQRNKHDSKKRLLFSSLEPNSDYITSHDISTICDKRKNFAEIYDDIVRAEEKMGVPKEKRFFSNVDNYFYIHQVMAEKGLTTPCRQCYVESMRKNLAPMANAFMELVNETDGSNKANAQLYHQKGKDKGKLKVGNAETREFVLSALEEYGMTPGDLNIEKLSTAKGLAELKIKAPNVYEAFNSFYGQSKPKMPKRATPFRFGELTALLTDDNGKINKKLVEKINHTGGFRLQSYSDFQVENFTDVLQVLFEAGTLGLNGHAYTKVPAFLEATDNTNLKRNISIFMYKDGNQWKLDRNDSFPYTLEEIYKLVDADKSGNTGIIAVSQNAEMSAWIMANDHIGYGIPYHKSGQKMDVVRSTVVRENGREIKGYSEAKDHTRQQSEVWAKASADHKALTKVKKGIDIYEFWDFDNQAGLSKTQLIEKNVKDYLDACEKAGYLPKFREYVLNNQKVLEDVLRYSKELGFATQDATIDDISFRHEVRDANGKLVRTYRVPYGYYKFLGDFGMFTPDGKASPQKTLSLEDYDFDKAVDFFADAETLRRNEILQQFANGELREQYRNSDLTTEELEQLAKQKRDEVVREVVGDDIAPVSHSLSDSTAPLAPVNNFDTFGKDLKREGYSSDTAPVKAETRQNIAPVQYSMTENGEQKPVVDHIREKMEKDLANLRERYEPQIEKYKGMADSKEETIGKLAWQLLSELQTMEKGKKVSWDLGYLLDHTVKEPADYRSLDIALKNIRDNPLEVVNPRSKAERFARQMLERQWQETLDYASDLEQEYRQGIEELATQANQELDAATGKPVAPIAQNSPAGSDVAPVAPTSQEVTEEKKAPTINRVMANDGPKAKQKKGSLTMKLRNTLVDKGSVIDDISIETGNPELIARYKSINNAAAKAQHMIGNGDAKAGVKALTEIQKNVKKVASEAEFDDYMYNRLNVDRMTMMTRYPGRHDIPVFGPEYSAAYSRAKVQEYEAKHPEFRGLANDVYAFVRNNQNLMIQEGFITRDTANLWGEMYPHYIPIERASFQDKHTHQDGRTGAYNPVKKLTGSEKELRPMFTAIADQTIAVQKAIAKNRFGKELRRMLNGVEARETASTGPVDGILQDGTIVYSDARGINGKVTGYDESRNQYSVQFKYDNGRTEEVWMNPEQVSQMAPDTAMDEAMRGFFDSKDLLKPAKGEENPIFTVFENGKRIEFEITPDIYDALKPTSDAMSAKIPILSQLTNARKRILTDLNPVFWLTNTPKDIQAILPNSKHPGATYGNLPNAAFQIASKGKWYMEYVENGGKQQSYFNEEERSLEKEPGTAKRILTGPARFIRGINESLEMMPRLAEYIASRKKGASIDVAMLDAARVTTDFSAAGDFSRMLNRNFVPFLTASISGSAQQVRNFREAKAKGAKGIAGYIMRQAIATIPLAVFNHLMWEDDEEYAEISDYVKQNYYIVGKTDDGKFIRIPKGREVAVIQDFYEQMANLVTGNFDDVDVGSFAQLAMTNIAPNNPIDNNILAPIIQAHTGTTWYGDDLIPSRLQKVPNAEQYDESTDAISKWIGEMTGMSPYRINYILDQYSGGFGDVILPMLTSEAESGSDTIGGKLLAPLADKFTVDSTMKNQYVSDFYDKVDELEINANSQNATDEDALMYAYMSSKNSEIGTLYGLKRKVNSAVTVGDLQDIAEELKPFLDSSSDPGLWYALNYGNQNSKVTDSSKYQIVRAIQRRIDDRAKKALDTYESVSLDGGYATIGSDHFVKKEDSWKKLSTDEYNEQKLMTKAMGIKPEMYWNSKAAFSSFKNDKDANGNTIKGSREDKVIDWINSQDIPYEAKIMLYKSMYTGYRGYDTEIIQYLRTNPDISYEQMVEILEKLGFKIN